MNRKKILLTTIADNINFGTYLQTVASAKLIENLGYDVDLLHYVREYLKIGNRIRTETSKTRNPLKKIKRTLKLLIWAKTRKRDWQFVQKHISLTPIYHSFEEIKSGIGNYDIYMTGSDQVWNSIHNQGLDKVFYCDFAPKGAKKVAFSASIGMTDFQQFEKKEVKVMLESYATISVRETSAKEILENLGIDNVKVTLDPTLTLSKDDWQRVVPERKKKAGEPYLLLYSVEPLKQGQIISEVAKKIAAQRGLKIYSMSMTQYHPKGSDKTFSYATPELFLTLIRNADYMVVSSFHGTAFAINFNKQFISVTPNKFSSRIESILGICNIPERKINNANDPLPIGDIDYTPINKILNSERVKTKQLLKEMLDE